jgi:hypothetical protein
VISRSTTRSDGSVDAIMAATRGAEVSSDDARPGRTAFEAHGMSGFRAVILVLKTN